MKFHEFVSFHNIIDFNTTCKGTILTSEQINDKYQVVLPGISNPPGKSINIFFDKFYGEGGVQAIDKEME